jgi:hypothetical protein
MSARHNMYDDAADFGAGDTAEVVLNVYTTTSSTSSVGSAPITVKISARKNPPPCGSILNSDDWIVLEKTDGD